METTTDYNKQATDFLNDTNTSFTATFKKHDIHFDGDKEPRDIYSITLERKGRKFTFDFGASIVNSGKYQVLIGNTIHRFSEKPKPHGEFMRKYSVQDREIKLNPDYKTPSAYDVLTCLTKYDVGTFDDFCSEFGYTWSNSKEYKAVEKIYKSVVNEFDNVQKLWNNDEIEQLQEIQ